MKKNAKMVSISAAVAMIFVTVFAILSLTLAWYIRDQSGTISSITMSAAGTGGIQLSGNALDWKSVLSTQGNDFEYDSNLHIDSISSAAEVVDGQMKFYTGKYGDYGFQTELVTPENVLYYTFDFYVINNDNVPKFFTLGYNSTVIDTNDKDIAFCTRVAFINLGNSATISGALALDGTGINSVDYIWEPNSTVRNKRVSLYHSVYIPEGKSPYNGIAMEATNLTLSNSLVIDSVATPEQEVVPVQTNDPIGSGDDNIITLLQSSSITKIRIFIWAEGQDIDCTNSISGGKASINFNFNSHNAEQVEGEYVSEEYFVASTASNETGVVMSWTQSYTNLSSVTFASQYMVRLLTTINTQEIVVRSIITNQTSININSLNPLQSGQYYFEVRAIANGFGNSAVSNRVAFEVLNIPTDLIIINNSMSWSAVPNASSYFIMAFDEDTQTSSFASTNFTAINLTSTLFSGANLISGKNYTISVRAVGALGYADSKYSTGTSWSF